MSSKRSKCPVKSIHLERIRRLDLERERAARKLSKKREAAAAASPLPVADPMEKWLHTWPNRHGWLLERDWTSLPDPKGYAVRYRHRVTKERLLVATANGMYRFSFRVGKAAKIHIGNEWAAVVKHIKEQCEMGSKQ